MAPLIEVAGMTKRYGSKRGVLDLTFHVAEGEVFGFLGPNGAGKTTTMRLLMALLFRDRGTAHIAGLDCWQQSVEVKHIVGYLPGELAFDRNLTGGQILTYFANLRGGVDRSYLQTLVSRLDLDVSRRFRHYSHGNRQKVGLIQAFMHRPRLLILDEPTSGLDPLNQAEFVRMVAEVRSEGRTVFLSSHILSEAEATCDRVAIIRDGHLARVGAVTELKDIRHHTIDLTFETTPPLEAFRALAVVQSVETLPDGRALRLTVRGGVDAVVKTAARYALIDFVSREPSLEEIFLRYYREESGTETKVTGRVAS